jgi:AcrR family transcriptional regulator
VLRAARELMAEGGATYVTMERLALRAGVGKPTIYRTWANCHEVVMAALVPAAPVAPAGSGTGKSTVHPPLEAWQGQLRQVVELFGSAPGRGLAMLLASADTDSEIARAFRNHFLEARRAEGRRLLMRAISEGAVRPGIDAEVVLDLVYGAILYRLIVQHQPLDARFADGLLEHVLAGLAA